MTYAPETVTSSYVLSDIEKASFADQGYIKLRGVLDGQQIDAFAPEITDKVVELNTQHLPLADRSTYDKAFLQVTSLWRHSERVNDFVRSPDLARLAAELLGVRGVRLYHDQALYKEPGGGITPWHADEYYWPFSTSRCVTVWIPLQDTPADMGPLTLAVGSHAFSHGRDMAISDESETAIARLMLEEGFPVDDAPYRLGDVSYHLGWTFHRAGQNVSTTARRVMTIIYVDIDMVIAEPTNDSQRRDLAVCIPGKKPGEVVASELNPVLYEC